MSTEFTQATFVDGSQSRDEPCSSAESTEYSEAESVNSEQYYGASPVELLSPEPGTPSPAPKRARTDAIGSRQYRGWAFTVFIPPGDPSSGYADRIRRAHRLCNASAGEGDAVPGGVAEYMCFQEEAASSTRRRHYQGYVYFRGRGLRLRGVSQALQAVFGIAPHCEPAIGNAAQNRAYCSKEETAIPGSFWESGVIPGQGTAALEFTPYNFRTRRAAMLDRVYGTYMAEFCMFVALFTNE